MRTALLALLAGCSSSPQVVADEPMNGADLRVVVAQTERVTELVALLDDEPYRFEGEPLEEVFDRGDRLRITVFGFSVETLGSEVPGLQGMAAAQIRDALRPALAPPGPGLYQLDAVAILALDVDDETDDRPDYVPLDAAAGAARAPLVFELEGALACPPADRPLRAFRRETPATACVFQRSEQCEWISPGCPNVDTLFGRPVQAVPRQLPDGRLLLAEVECTPDDALRPGETMAWRCPEAVVAAQEIVPALEGGDWVLDVRHRFVAAELGDRHLVAPAVEGVLIASERQGEIDVNRLSVRDGATVYESLQAPIVDGVGLSQTVSAASWTDGSTVTLADRSFNDRVGNSTLQCFATLSGARSVQTALITSVTDDTISVSPPLIGGSPTTAWTIFGDPGPNLLLPPLRTIEPSAVGALRRLSSAPGSPNLILHGADRTLRFERLEIRFPSDLNYYTCGIPVPHPAGLISDLVTGANGLYALSADGVDLFDAQGGLTERIATDRTFVATDRIFVVRRPDGSDLVIVSRGAGVVELLSPDQTVDQTVTLQGDVLAVFDGPKILFRRSGATRLLTVVEPLSAVGTIDLPLPPFQDGPPEPVRIDPQATLELDGRTLVGFTDGTRAGVLDLNSGLSQAVAVDGARVTALFGARGGRAAWAMVENAADAAEVEILAIPLPAER